MSFIVKAFMIIISHTIFVCTYYIYNKYKTWQSMYMHALYVYANNKQ